MSNFFGQTGGGGDINPPTTALFDQQQLGTGVGLAAAYDLRKGLTVARTDTGTAAAERIGFLGKAVPAGSNWTAEMTVRHPPICTTSGAYIRTGLCLFESATGKHLLMGLNTNNNSPALVLMHWTAIATYGTQPYGVGSRTLPPVRYRVVYDGTNYVFSVSFDDGEYYFTVYTAGKASFFTTAADLIGVGLQSFQQYSAGFNQVQIPYYSDPDRP